jgi:hypothetical protein
MEYQCYLDQRRDYHKPDHLWTVLKRIVLLDALSSHSIQYATQQGIYESGFCKAQGKEKGKCFITPLTAMEHVNNTPTEELVRSCRKQESPRKFPITKRYRMSKFRPALPPPCSSSKVSQSSNCQQALPFLLSSLKKNVTLFFFWVTTSSFCIPTACLADPRCFVLFNGQLF